MSLFSKTATLAFLASLDPRIHDALIPHTHFTKENLHVMASSVIKSIAQKVTNADTAKELNSAGKSLFKAGLESMDYDDNFFPVFRFEKKFRDIKSIFGRVLRMFF